MAAGPTVKAAGSVFLARTTFSIGTGWEAWEIALDRRRKSGYKREYCPDGVALDDAVSLDAVDCRE